MLKRNIVSAAAVLFCLIAILSGLALSQGRDFKAPEIILPVDIINLILNEVSGQQAYNNEAMMAGYNRIRTAEEFDGYFYEADYLAKKLREYGIDEVKIESLDKGVNPGQTWWAGLDAELWMVQPEKHLLSRLAEAPALIARGSDAVDCEGEVVYVDRRDVRKQKDMNLSGKIILTPESSGWFAEAFEKGALGVISFQNYVRPLEDPDQVVFDMRLEKGKTKNKVFGFQISQRLGYQLRDMIFQEQKVVLHVTTKTAEFPWKADTVFAVVKGNDPAKKGLMFTAHLFERPAKIGANDNVSGSVVLAEVARTLNKLIKEGKLERPERSVYFLWSEEGSGTMAFFRKYPEMKDKIFGAINMDMVGENLDESHAFFGIEIPLFSKPTFLSSVAKNFANYVFETNIEKHSYQPPTPWETFPVPIVEKNGTHQPFRFQMNRFEGGSDHGIFIESDAGIPALSFNVWPDFWYHTDKDTPDKSDPTQLKRVAFIGTTSALAVCSGREDVLENLVRLTYEDRLGFIQEAVAHSISDLSRLKAGDKGATYKNALNHVNEAIRLSQATLGGAREIVQNKKKVSDYLENIIRNLGDLGPPYSAHLKNYYVTVAALNKYSPEFPKPSAEEMKLQKMIPSKVKPNNLGDRFPYTSLFDALKTSQELQMMVFSKYGYRCLVELFLSIDGKKDLAQIRNLLSFEFEPVEIGDLQKLVKALEDAKLIEFPSAKAAPKS